MSCLLIAFYLLVISVTAEADVEKTTPPEHACLVGDSVKVVIDIEVADSPAKRQQGLMGRKNLGTHDGMLFVYDRLQPPSTAFWMYRTHLPLDIAYIGPNDQILAINAMTPCTAGAHECPKYPAGVSFNKALEMNRGFFAAEGIDVGDTFVRSHEADCSV
ncbi:MAG: DUF192 domain-containing protein [Oleiphilaceae bacterium]|nr:DUF192 domain-containing protein [Oleiphilaceae bacterium]